MGLPKGEYETLSGFLLHHLGRIPPVGTQYRQGPLTFLVTRATDRAIQQVHLTIDRGGKAT